jgi:propionyl-CoA carboxylase alpha chain
MGLKTIAVYSEADASARHVDMADESFLIGPAPARESYLNANIILETALEQGADAIHPGYGFLSENAEFADAVSKANLTFIGPPADVIRLMGDKLQAKGIAHRAGVSLVPGSEGPITSHQEILKFAKEFGYPILLKAAAGGGGKGMRIIEDELQMEESLERTSHEALMSFGDGRIFVEKYLKSPRHIEIQILADQHGNIIHLGERDCSLQRRHQKVIEECPSPFMTSTLREKMVDQAISLAKHVGYSSVGTIEFMVTPDHNSYFLEMNTRLQVEHPITELRTGLDLVEQMIRVAAGESLSMTQDQVSFKGHAVEARVYAEDATQNFMPSSGRITRFEVPSLDEHVRLDTGIEAGSEVSVYYDPMIAKLSAWAPKRDEALDKLRHGLAQFIIDGPIHNLGFLENLLHQPRVMQGDYTTRFIEHEWHPELTLEQKHIVYAVAGHIHLKSSSDQHDQWIVVEGEIGTSLQMESDHVQIAEKKISLELNWQPFERRFVVNTGSESLDGQVKSHGQNITIRLFGIDTTVQVVRPNVWELMSHIHPPAPTADKFEIKAPMPGILISLPINVGDLVQIGQPLLVIEAMKMENILKSPTNGKVKEIFVKNGDSLLRDQILVRLG